jgi:hypothetical protein
MKKILPLLAINKTSIVAKINGDNIINKINADKKSAVGLMIDLYKLTFIF